MTTTESTPENDAGNDSNHHNGRTHTPYEIARLARLVEQAGLPRETVSQLGAGATPDRIAVHPAGPRTHYFLPSVRRRRPCTGCHAIIRKAPNRNAWTTALMRCRNAPLDNSITEKSPSQEAALRIAVKWAEQLCGLPEGMGANPGGLRDN